YSDDDYTGADRRRPEFNRLLHDAEQRRFDIILCKTQSRFTRELELVEKYIHGLFPIWGIRFVSIVDNADTANKGNKKSRQINGLVNEWYLEDMSENIRSVLTNRRINGFHIGAFALYGYMKDPDQKGHLIIDEEAAAVVREVFTLFSQGYGKTAIARMLNDRGIPNPTEYKRLHGLRYKQPKMKNSTLWKYYAIADMLVNEIYIGNMVQGKYGSISYKTKQNKPRPKSEWYIVEGTHEPIIDRELWDRVQALVAQRAKPFDTGTIGLFARKARCANCGYVMRSSKNHGNHYLKCSNRHVSKDACIGSFISVERLEQLVIDELNRLSAEFLDRDELEQNIEFCNNLNGQKARLLSDIAVYQKKIEEYSKGIRELYMDKVKGLITESDYMEMSKDFVADRDRLERVIAEDEKQLSVLDEKIAAGDNRRELIEEYTNLEHLTREMVETLIDYVSVGKRIPGTRDVPIEIHWNF
ncbi:MAG: recombinase family protein, partial [Oscillospiraceae bacterium]|nr:recombinase family protein [Oscillospiraceae bacterium]